MKRTHLLTVAATAGNVAASWTNDTGQNMKLCFAEQRITTDATVANRYGTLTLKNAAGATVCDLHAAAAVTASLSNQHIQYMQGVYRETSFANNALEQPIPMDFLVPPGFSVEFGVTNGVAGDSWTCDAMFAEA